MAKKDIKGITVKKDQDFSEWYSQVVQKADLADLRFGVQGFIVHPPWGFFIIRKIYEYLEAEVEAQGHLPFLFPSVVKEENLNKEKEHAGFTPEVFWVSEAGSQKIEERFALRPTGETQIYPLYALWFRSYRDLPFKGYQSRISAFRNEMTTRPFLRGREFLFFETHNVYNTHQEALDQIDQDLQTCQKVIKEKIKIPFFYFQRPAWDKFKGADATFTPDTLMPDGRRNQLASTHDLGTNFSKAFNIKIKNEVEKEQFAWQTCFGPGIWRLMAALIGIHGDDQGLILPFDMAPLQVVIIPILFAQKEALSQKTLNYCQKIASQLSSAGYRTFLDLSEDSPGAKYNQWELKGVPIRLEVGPKEVEQNSLSLVLRTDQKRHLIKLASLGSETKRQASLLDQTLQNRADAYFKEKVREASSLKELINLIETYRGFIRIPFCSVDWDGEKCDVRLQAETQGGKVCGTLYPKEDKIKPNQKCLICGKKARHLVYVAKSY